jgi:peptidyl-prolyl cis-trans isomerase C
MKNIKKKVASCIYPVLIVLGACILSSCSAQKAVNEEVVITINDHEITLSEFNNLFEATGLEGTLENRKQFANNLITRKLLLQEAQRQGLDKEEDFLKTIENFWSQSLLQTVIARKVKEDPKNSEVSDVEIRSIYDEWKLANPDQVKSFEDMKKFIKWQVIKKRQTEALDEWVDELLNKADINVKGKDIGTE